MLKHIKIFRLILVLMTFSIQCFASYNLSSTDAYYGTIDYGTVDIGQSSWRVAIDVLQVGGCDLWGPVTPLLPATVEGGSDFKVISSYCFPMEETRTCPIYMDPTGHNPPYTKEVPQNECKVIVEFAPTIPGPQQATVVLSILYDDVVFNINSGAIGTGILKISLPPYPSLAKIKKRKKPIRKPIACTGSIIEVDNQALGESIPVSGTPYSLFYYSDRVPGRLNDYKLSIPLVEGDVPSSLTSIDVDIYYADREFHQTFQPSKDLSYDFFWDGKDSSGKLLPGSTDAFITVTNKGPGGSLASTSIETIGGRSAKTIGLNGWSLDVVHFYDTNSGIVYLGGGGFIPDTGNSYQGGFTAPSKDGLELYIFDQFGKHIKTLNGLTGDLKLKFNYNKKNALISIVDHYGNKTIIQHQDQHAVKIISPYGQETLLNVDANGWLSEVTNPNLETYKMTYKSKGLLGSFQKPGGQISYMTYDPLGQLIKDQGAAGNFLSLFKISTENGWSIQTETAEGIKTQYDILVDDFNFTRKITDARDLKTITIDKPQGTSEERTPEGLVSQETAVSDPRFGSFAPYINSSSIWVEGTNLNYVEKTIKEVQFLTAGDNFHIKTQSIKTTLQNDFTKTFSTIFDGVTRQFVSTSPQGRRSIASLNTNSEVASFQKGNLKAVQTNYDEKGRVSSMVQGDRQVRFFYDSSGNLSRSVDVLGRSTSYLYDKAGRVIEKTLPNLASIKFSYDKNGNLTSITPPQKKTHNFPLNPFELVAEYLPPILGGKATATQYSYNLDKQLTKISRPDGKNIEFIYEQNSGVPSSILIPNGEYAHSYYEESGQISKLKSPDGVETLFEYTGPLLRKEESSFEKISPVLSLDYNSDFSLKSISASEGTSHSEIYIKYDRDNLPIKIGTEDLSYDENALLSSIDHKQLKETLYRNEFGELIEDKFQFSKKDKNDKGDGFAIRLKRDQLGRIIQKTEIFGHDDKNSFDYIYDANDQLIEVLKDGHSFNKYVYDSNGNRIKINNHGRVVDAIYDEQDRLLRYGKNKYKYNNNGDLEEKLSHEGKNLKFEYDVFGNLKKVQVGKKEVIEYLVDGKNRRVGKKINGKLIQAFVYQSQTQIAAELDGKGNIVKRFVYGSKPNIPDYFIANGKEYRIISDQVGTPKLIVDLSTGKVIQKYEFDEFGNLRDNDDYNERRENKMLLPFGFAGGLYDPETKLVRFGARDYDPEIGRWSSKDPIGFNGGDSNLYRYVNNDPVNEVDPSGLKTTLITTYDYGIGSHSALLVETPGQTSFLYDPAGSYPGKGSGDFIEGVTLSQYIAYQKSTGSNVDTTILNTTKGQESAIIQQAMTIGGAAPFACAKSISNALGGACGISGSSFPGTLNTQAKKANGCPK